MGSKEDKNLKIRKETAINYINTYNTLHLKHSKVVIILDNEGIDLIVTNLDKQVILDKYVG